jgi:hypothetical protein
MRKVSKTVDLVAAKVARSGTNLPEDRAAPRNIYTTSNGDRVGEGSLVRFAGFVLDAHYSNVSKDESV